MTAADIGMDFVLRAGKLACCFVWRALLHHFALTHTIASGYNEWAEANSLVILYPQAIRSLVLPLNPNGCWDWWSYTGLNYGTRGAPQIAMIHNMATALLSGDVGLKPLE